MTAPTERIPRRSAMGALQAAIVTAITAHPRARVALGDRIFSLGTVPKDAAAPYVELGDSSERANNYFGTGGNTNVETLTIVTPRSQGKPGVGVVLGILVDALDGVRIVIQGHRLDFGRVELVTVFPDPDVAHTRAVVQYTVQSRTVASE